MEINKNIGNNEFLVADEIVGFYTKTFLAKFFSEIFSRVEGLDPKLMNSFIGKTSSLSNDEGILDILVKSAYHMTNTKYSYEVVDDKIVFSQDDGKNKLQTINIDFSNNHIFRITRIVYCNIANIMHKELLDIEKANGTIIKIDGTGDLTPAQKPFFRKQLTELMQFAKRDKTAGFMDAKDDIINYEIQPNIMTEYLEHQFQILSGGYGLPVFFFNGKRDSGAIGNNGIVEQMMVINSLYNWYLVLEQPLFMTISKALEFNTDFTFNKKPLSQPEILFQIIPTVESSAILTENQKKSIYNYYGLGVYWNEKESKEMFNQNNEVIENE